MNEFDEKLEYVIKFETFYSKILNLPETKNIPIE